MILPCSMHQTHLGVRRVVLRAGFDWPSGSCKAYAAWRDHTCTYPVEMMMSNFQIHTAHLLSNLNEIWMRLAREKMVEGLNPRLECFANCNRTNNHNMIPVSNTHHSSPSFWIRAQVCVPYDRSTYKHVNFWPLPEHVIFQTMWIFFSICLTLQT